MHCGLETAGLLKHAHTEAAAVDSSCDQACQGESCAVIEDGIYKNKDGFVEVSAPVLTLWITALIAIPADVFSTPSVTPEKTDSPPELARTWQFSARTALLPGAPAILA